MGGVPITAEVKADLSESNVAEPKQEAASADVALHAVAMEAQNGRYPSSQSNVAAVAEATTGGHNIPRDCKDVEVAREDRTPAPKKEAQSEDLTLKHQSPKLEEDGVSKIASGLTLPHGLCKVKAEAIECAAVFSCAEACSRAPKVPPPQSKEGPELNLLVGAGNNSRAGASPSPRRPAVTVGAFIVQCVACCKYRWTPNKLVYEFLREVSAMCPFICRDASAWRPDCSCAEPTDVTPGDAGFVWAIDRGDITRPPFGWERKVVIRGEGSVIFSDVYYLSPEGRLLRSMRDVVNYLDDHPEIQLSLASFNFGRPRPLGRKAWKRKRYEYE